MSRAITLKNIFKSQAVRYLVVGGTAYIFEITLLYGLSNIPTIGVALAVTISFWLGLIFSFLIQRFVTFKDTSKSLSRLSRQTVQYALLVFINFAFTLAFVTLSEPFLGLLASRTVAIIVTTLWNYYIYKKIIFVAVKQEQADTTTDRKKIPPYKNIIQSERFMLSIAIIPILVFCLPMLSSGSTLFPGDFDMQVQMTEAAKISILEHGQFPWWNPWVSGGVPLFADPQFGFVTPQTILSFFMSSALAWKVTITLYLIAGFFSFFILLRHVTRKSHLPLLILVSYIWIFGSFFSLRAAGGHFTFMILALLPLAIFLLAKCVESKKYIIPLALTLAFFLNAAVHYSSILSLLTLGVIATLISLISLSSLIITSRKMRRAISVRAIFVTLQPLTYYLVATLGAFTLTSIRLLFSASYLASNSVERTDVVEPFIGFGEGLRSLFLPYGSYRSNEVLTYGQFEASNFIGTFTGIALVILVIVIVIHSLKVRSLNILIGRYKIPLIITLLVGVLFFATGLGGFLFETFRQLPVISSMRVSTRFFTITSLCVLVILVILASITLQHKILGKYTRLGVYGLVLIAVVQVFFVNFNFQRHTWIDNPTLLYVYNAHEASSKTPYVEINWRDQPSSAPYYHALTAATVANRVQAVADNALVDTRSLATQRCDHDARGCSFVLSNNADVSYWSPNEIRLTRTSNGDIQLNLNQARSWLVNGVLLFKNQKVIESNSTFTIPSGNEQKYTLRYSPLNTLSE